MDNLRDIVRALVNNTDEKYCVVAKVLSVDKTANTVDVEPLDDSAELVEVRLQAGTGKGMVAYPIVGSTVVISFLSKNEAYVSLVSEVEAYDLQSQNESLKAILADILAAIKTLTVTTPVGPSGVPVNVTQFTNIENRLNNLFK